MGRQGEALRVFVPPTTPAETLPEHLRAVFFDLDDTLYDHRHAQRAGIAALRRNVPELHRFSLDTLLRTDAEMLEEVHRTLVRAGRVTLEESRRERMRRFARRLAVVVSEEEVRVWIAVRGEAYRRHQRAVPGARPVLRHVRSEGCHVGVVTNNLAAEQERKIRDIGLSGLLDSLTVSETAGFWKPDPRIFRAALAGVPCRPEESVMVGDSLRSDIRGAHRAGIPAVWLDRRTYRSERRPPGVPRLTSLWPPRVVVRAIRAARRPSRPRATPQRGSAVR